MSPEQLMINVALANWKLAIKRASGIFSELSDEQFFTEIAPGRNRPIYLLGHLTAVNDAMLPLIGLGERQYPELEDIFIKSPDKSIDPLPPLATLKQHWTDLNTLLIDGFTATTPEQWLSRHTAMTDEDYAADPTRNRLNVLLNRTNHTAMHMGQLVLARKKS